MKAFGFYGYPNTRIRARKSALFDQSFFEQLIKAPNTNKIIATLTETDYRKDIEQGLLKHPGMIGVEEGLKLHLVNTFTGVKNLLKGNEQGQNLVGLMLARFDLYNIKTILRGFHSNVSKEEILNDLIPAGELDKSLLRDLTNQLSLKACIDQLVIFNIAYAKPLFESYYEYSKTRNLSNLELNLDKFYYEYILQRTRGFSKNIKIVKELVQRDIDMTNIMTLLRLTKEMFFGEAKETFIKQKKEDKASVANKLAKPIKYVWQAARKAGFLVAKLFERLFKKQDLSKKIYVAGGPKELEYRRNLGKSLSKIAIDNKNIEEQTTDEEFKVDKEKQLANFFIEGGKEVTKENFIRLAKLGNIERIVEGFRGTSYYKPLREGLKNHLVTGSLSAIERKIEDFNIKKTVNLFRGDPLSIGVVVGYMWAKFNEVINLRIIFRGKEVEMPEKEIKEALVLV